MSAELTWHDRIVNDGSDRESWESDRRTRIGASDAAKYARASSAESYAREKLRAKSFHGNAATARGNRWEPMLLAWAGFDQSKVLVHSPTEPGFVATPDGIREDADGLHLAESKAKHEQILTAPPVREIRQMAFQLLVVPEAVDVTYVWGELVQDKTLPEDHPDRWRLRRDPQTLVFTRDHPQILAATTHILPIAREVLSIMRAASLERSPF